MKMKLFFSKKGSFEMGDVFTDKVQTEINTWLHENPGIEIVDIRQSTGGGSFEQVTIVTSIWYEKESGTRER